MNKSLFRFFLSLFVVGNCFSEHTRHVETMINDPSTMVDGKVNVITGHPCVYSEDVVIQGAEPIRLSRVYLHAESEGYWKLPGNPCEIYQDGTYEGRDKDYQWIINEPDGCPIYFKPAENERVIDGKKYKEYYPSNLNLGFSNTSQGEISSRTNHHNYRAFFDKKSVGNDEAPKRVFLHTPDGRVREYKRTSKKPYLYLLLSEHLPNGNWVLYEYGTNEKETETYNKLLKIETKNPSKSKVFASASFKHTKYKDDKDRNEKFLVTGSDGQKVEYYCKGGKKDLHSSFKHLKEIDSSSFPHETVHYTQFMDDDLGLNKKKKEEDRLEILSRPLSRAYRIGYYTKKEEKVAGQQVKLDKSGLNDDAMGYPSISQDYRWGRVKEISAPVGTTRDLCVTHSFIYNGNNKTTVYDFEGKRAVYHVDGESRLRKLERFSKEGTLVSADCYEWRVRSGLAGLITSKSLVDENKRVISSIGYSYDSIGNVVEKKFYGNLSGFGIAPILKEYTNTIIDNGTEFATTKYSYTEGKPSLLVREENPSGLVKLYTYLERTDRLTSELTCNGNEIKSRKFWEYSDGILTRQIEDDGSSQNPEDLTNVTYRTIQETVPYSEGRYAGLPQVVYEKYFDGGSEKLLSKRIYKYGNAAKITEVAVFDANEVYRYTLYKEYDKKNRLSSETDAIGRKACYSYDELGNLINAVDFSGRIEAKTEYDFSDRPTSMIHKGDDGIVNKAKYAYNGLHQLLKKVDPKGHETQYEYNPLGYCTKTEHPSIVNENNKLITLVTQKKYDAAGNVVESIDAMGNITKTSYTAYNKPISITHPDGATEQFSYFLNGNLKSHTNPKGVKTEYTYDYLDRVLNKKMLSLSGELLAEESFKYKGDLLVSEKDAMGNTTYFSYDGAGRKIKEECQGETTRYEYDAFNRLYKEQKGDIVLVTEKDLLDRVIEERTETPTGTVVRKMGYEYDRAGNKKTIIHYIAGDIQKEKLEYDSQNRLNYREDPLGWINLTVHNDFFVNELGQKVLQTVDVDPLGLEMYKTYNSHGHISKIEKRKKKTLKKEELFYTPNGDKSLHRETVYRPDRSSHLVDTRWEYDNRGRVTSLIEAANTQNPKITKHTYTSIGELATTTKPDGVVLNYGYSDLGFHTTLTSSDGSVSHQMEYDKLGHLVSFDGIKREYDFAGRLLKESLPGGMTLVNEYDLSGRRIYCRVPEAHCVMGYTYRGPDLHFVFRGCSKKGFMYQHQYNSWDLSGNLLEESLIEDKGTVSYTFDSLSRKKQVRSPYFNEQVLEFDPIGNIRKMHIQEDEVEYDYDDLYQLTSETGLFAHNYQFDSLHNRLQKDEETYEVNEKNELISHMEYDLNGNPIKNEDTTYAYDALDRLIKVETPEYTEIYEYDFLHRRRAKTTGSKETREQRYFLYDGLNEIGSYDTENELKELRVLGHAPHAEIGAAIAIELGEEIFAPIHDLQGNIASLVPTSSNEEVTSYRYSAFGEERREGKTLCPWRYSSKRTEATGLVNYGRRYYSPQFGRWLTPDPSGFTDGMNLYAFLNNNSLTHFDEYGLFSVSEQFEKIQPILTNPRFQGAIQAFTGFNEVVAGAGISCGSGLFAAPLGFAVMGHGVDHFVTGMKQVITGSYAETATSQVLQKTGLGGQTANLIDNSFSIAGMAKGAAVKQLDQGTFAPKNLTPKVPEKRFQKFPTEEIPNNTYPVPKDILNEHLRQWQEYGTNGICKLQNGRVRYYGSLESPRIEGEMIGRRLVREWAPKTGLKRTWHETFDGNGTIRIVRPQINGESKRHFEFNKSGEFIREW